MQKALKILLAVSMIAIVTFAVTACGEDAPAATPTPATIQTPTPEPAPTPTPDDAEVSEQDEATMPEPDTSSIDWQEFLRLYEAWVDDYIDLLERHAENPLDPTLMTEYTELMMEAIEWAERADDIQDELSGDELIEFAQATQRILNRILQAQLP